jgi:hypothetical protein
MVKPDPIPNFEGVKQTSLDEELENTSDQGSGEESFSPFSKSNAGAISVEEFKLLQSIFESGRLHYTELERQRAEDGIASNKHKRANYRLILLTMMGVLLAATLSSGLISTGKVAASDSQKSQAQTTLVGLTTALLGYLAGYNVP